MTALSISELVNKITDRICENHERAIDGMDLQELLIDIIDSLSAYTSGVVVTSSDRRAGTKVCTAGSNIVTFDSPFEAGTTYIILKTVMSDDDNVDIGGTISNESINGFWIDVEEDSTLHYLAIPL